MMDSVMSGTALARSIAIASVGGVLTDCELLSLHKHFRRDSLLTARGRLDRLMGRTALMNTWTRLMHKPSILVIIGLRLAACIVIIYSVTQGSPSRLALVTYCICTLLLNLRGGIGNNGSDQMTTIVLFLACIAALVDTPVVVGYVVLTIALQLSLAYLAAGGVKLTSRAWLSGEAVCSIMKSQTFGCEPVYRLFSRSRRIATLIGIAVVCTEVLCAAAPWLPPRACVALLVIAAVSHISIAITMGLNTFVPAFLAAYPSALCVSAALWSHA
jgi:hypothetical protein